MQAISLLQRGYIVPFSRIYEKNNREEDDETACRILVGACGVFMENAQMWDFVKNRTIDTIFSL
jgi:hypothetical protein